MTLNSLRIRFGYLLAALALVLHGGSTMAVCCQTAQAPAATSTAHNKQTQAATVSPLTDTERELTGGETHSHRADLAAGQFLYAPIEQVGIDVAVIVFGPDGQQVSSTDSPNDRWGTEPVLLLANANGPYRIDVRAPSSKTAVGRYTIRIIALRSATETDKGHVHAQRTFEEAQKLLAQDGAVAKRASIEKFKESLPLFKAANDFYRQALALRAIGRGLGQLSEFRNSSVYWSEALALAKSVEDQRLEAGLEADLGFAYDTFGDIDKALDHHNRALILARKLDNRFVEASALNNIGKIYNDISDLGKALEYYLQALPLFRALANTRAEGITLNNLGIAYSLAGEQDKALAYLAESLQLLRKSGDKNAEAYNLSNIGGTYGRGGDYHKALTYYRDAQAIQTQTGNRGQQAETLDLMGAAYAGLSEYEKAIDHHERALVIHRTTENLRRVAMSLNNLGRAQYFFGQSGKALQYFEESLGIFRTIGDLDNAADVLEGRARAKSAEGRFEEARQSAEESLLLTETVRSRAGSQQLRTSYFASMGRIYDFYINLLMQQHRTSPNAGFDAEALKASERGRARSLMEMLAESRVAIRQGVNPSLVERERILVNLINAKAQRQIQLLSRKGNKEELTILGREISRLEDDYQQIQAAIRKTSPAYAALTQPQPLGLNEIQQQLDPETILLEYSLGDERSYLWAVTSNSLQSFELPKREQIQESARRIYNLLTARSQSIPRETTAAKKQRISEADAQLSLMRELSRMVLPAQLELGGKRLVVVADGALQYVPFGALPLSRGVESSANVYRPLIADHEVVTLPSASALAVHRNNLANRKLAANAVAVMADPVFSTADERLTTTREASSVEPRDAESDNTRIIEHIADDSTGKLSIRRLHFTRQEAEQILAVSPRATNLKAMDFKATRAMAISGDLSRYRYVHFATHGYIDSERSDLSAIVLSLVDQKGNAQDGFLRAHEIYNLNLPAELVVLSACQTGLGKEIKGEGLVGLTQAFMYAGARRVVVSLWSVNDKATAELMRRFYRGMLKQGRTPAAALRQAQFEMSRDAKWQSPYYWAPFVLQGEWR